MSSSHVEFEINIMKSWISILLYDRNSHYGFSNTAHPSAYIRQLKCFCKEITKIMIAQDVIYLLIIKPVLTRK